MFAKNIILHKRLSDLNKPDNNFIFYFWIVLVTVQLKTPATHLQHRRISSKIFSEMQYLVRISVIEFVTYLIGNWEAFCPQYRAGRPYIVLCEKLFPLDAAFCQNSLITCLYGRMSFMTLITELLAACYAIFVD